VSSRQIKAGHLAATEIEALGFEKHYMLASVPRELTQTIAPQSKRDAQIAYFRSGR
jgi:hypothetical protein